MDRARRAGLTALIVALLVTANAPGGRPALAAAVAWPVSTLVVSEFQTGGASASDEFVEIANQGPAPVDIVGLELVYATASGSTVTRKAAWDVVDGPAARSALPAGERGRRLRGHRGYRVLGRVRGDGRRAGDPDRRRLGHRFGRLGRRDERHGRRHGRRRATGRIESRTQARRHRPGTRSTRTTTRRTGSSRDAVAAGFRVASRAERDAHAHANAAAGPTPTPTPSHADTGPPDADTRADANADPDARATPTPRRPRRPTPTPTPRRRRRPTPTPAPEPSPIASARALADDTMVTIEGVLTTDLGALESGRGGFVQDGSGGIAIYLDAAAVGSWPAGTHRRAPRRGLEPVLAADHSPGGERSSRRIGGPPGRRRDRDRARTEAHEGTGSRSRARSMARPTPSATASRSPWTTARARCAWSSAPSARRRRRSRPA